MMLLALPWLRLLIFYFRMDIGSGLLFSLTFLIFFLRLCLVEAVAGRMDVPVWVPHSLGYFSVSSAWGVLRPSRPSISYIALLWFWGNIPKHSFIAWLAVRDQLSTRDRLRRWGAVVHSDCVFCTGQESRDHLSFECPFNTVVWDGMLFCVGSSHHPAFLVY